MGATSSNATTNPITIIS